MNVDKIIERYCKETNFVIGSSKSAIKRFAEWYAPDLRAENERLAEQIKTLKSDKRKLARKHKKHLMDLYECAVNGIEYVGMANYQERVDEALRKLESALDTGEKSD